jgi:hypothetical protein
MALPLGAISNLLLAAGDLVTWVDPNCPAINLYSGFLVRTLTSGELTANGFAAGSTAWWVTSNPLVAAGAVSCWPVSAGQMISQIRPMAVDGATYASLH